MSQTASGKDSRVQAPPLGICSLDVFPPRRQWFQAITK
ncbi:hypothetical protein SAMN04488548_12033 [Gordonia westfalica]|uniref:Uncharacterized protein n=1 Tax=Gordonia westfalica TaxID=158898 RepID=A0A1H2DRX2_9ACTN|nr:hypothetical protein SAMN04488548_12033 [Gordonia westfalica]